MSMDLMYGCIGGSDFDKSLQELIECDLKSNLDSSNPTTPDLMAELANGPLLLNEDGFDEFSIQFDPTSHRLFESYGLSFSNLMDHHHNNNSPSTNSSTTTTGLIKSININSPVRHHHITSVSNYNYISASSHLRNSHHHGHGGSRTSSSSHGISFDEQYGILVDPSSIVPVSVGSVGSASGSETDPECINTDEEDEPDPNPKTWMNPNNNSSSNKTNGSLTPSPENRGIINKEEPEFELIEEPDFILSEQPIVQHEHQQGPPPKKRKQKHEPQPHTDGKIYPKPGFSYSCLIAMALKNSKTGSLPVSEIYKFMCDHFPYFKSAPSGWKNSVRHNLSLNKCFEKIEKPGNAARKGCLWALNPAKIHKMDEEVQKWLKKDTQSIIRAMSDPENMELIERGELKRDYSGGNGGASDEEDEELVISEPVTPMTPAAAPAPAGRVSRENSTETITIDNSNTTTTTGTPIIISSNSSTATATPTSAVTMSQLRATLQQASQLNKLESIGIGLSPAQLGALGNVVCHSNGTYTLSFSGLQQPTSTTTTKTVTPAPKSNNNSAANNNSNSSASSTSTTPIIIRRSPPVK